MKRYFSNLYYRKSIIAYLLLPIALAYYFIIKLRKYCYQHAIFKSKKFPVPVIVVGNITLGGTGKTPLVIYLIELLKQQGYKPGVVSRGYGGKAQRYPCKVTESTKASEVGDEPTLIFLRTKVPVVVDPIRINAAEVLINQYDCDVVISDDGLQHYALQRDIEIAVIDSHKKFGNGFLFPAGPLREPRSRLKSVDMIITNGESHNKDYFSLKVEAAGIINLVDNDKRVSAEYFSNKQLIAMAGIGNPERFFKTLSQLGLSYLKHPLPDHYHYTIADFKDVNDSQIIMTEKDAVKAKSYAKGNMWYVPIKTMASDSFNRLVLDKLQSQKLS